MSSHPVPTSFLWRDFPLVWVRLPEFGTTYQVVQFSDVSFQLASQDEHYDFATVPDHWQWSADGVNWMPFQSSR
jgi:hypothetical protein